MRHSCVYMFKWFLMLVSMSGDCCECVMTLTSREHQRVTRTGVTRGEGGDSPDRRHNYDREPGSGSGSSRDNRLELQRGNSIIGIVLPKCQASAQAQQPGLCVWSWLIWKYLQSENMINCLLSGLHHHSYPSLEFRIPSYPWMTGYRSFELLLGLTWKFSPFSSEKMNAKRRKSLMVPWNCSGYVT